MVIKQKGNASRGRGLNDREAAEYLGLKPSTMRKYRFEGRGPAYHKFGKRCVYFTDDLDEYRDSRRIEPRRA
jgi:hypothetical protein